MDRTVLHYSRPIVPILLAFCACFVDVVCIIGLFHTFTAFISGTLVVLCVEVFHTADNALLKVFVLIVFFASSLFWYVAVTRLADRAFFSIGRLLALEAVLIAAFMLVAVTGDPQAAGALAPATLGAVGLSTVAMALQNVIMLTILNRHVPTTMMTGNSLKLVLGNRGLFRPSGRPHRQPVTDHPPEPDHRRFRRRRTAGELSGNRHGLLGPFRADRRTAVSCSLPAVKGTGGCRHGILTEFGDASRPEAAQ